MEMKLIAAALLMIGMMFPAYAQVQQPQRAQGASPGASRVPPAQQAQIDLQQFIAEWQAMSGALVSLSRARDHVEDQLQKFVSQAQEDARQRADAESRLKWVLDNWVPKTPAGGRTDPPSDTK